MPLNHWPSIRNLIIPWQLDCYSTYRNFRTGSRPALYGRLEYFRCLLGLAIITSWHASGRFLPLFLFYEINALQFWLPFTFISSDPGFECFACFFDGKKGWFYVMIFAISFSFFLFFFTHRMFVQGFVYFPRLDI